MTLQTLLKDDKELFNIAECVKQQATPDELEKFKQLNTNERAKWVIQQIQKNGGITWEHFQQNLNKVY